MLDLNKLSLQIQQASFDLASHQGVLRERQRLRLIPSRVGGRGGREHADRSQQQAQAAK